MLTPTNNGPSDATFVFVTDTLPAGTTFLSSTPSICSEDGDIFCNIGSLTAGQSSPFTIDVTVTAPPGQISNTASVAGSQTDPQSENDSAVEMTTVDPDVIADLSVGVADVPDPVDAGTNLTYNVTVMNEGTGEATTSVLDVTLDPALSFVSASGPPPARASLQGAPLCTPSGNMVSCALGTIPPAGGSMVSIIASVNPDQMSGVSSQFDVSTVLDEEDFLNNTTTANTEVTPSTDLSVTKTDSVDPAKTGGLLIYTLTATNNGPSNATGVVLEDALPEGVAFFSASPSICTANGALSCNFGNLSVDQSKQVAVTVTVEAPPETTLSNTATLSGEQTDPNGSNNSATELTEVELTADLEVELEFSPEVPYFGLPTSFLINFRNLGPDAANTGNVSVVFPGTFSIDSAIGSIPCSTFGSQVVCNFANLPSGQVESVSINATAPQGGDFPVTATVTSLSTDPVTENNTAQVMLSIPGDIDLKIVKEAVFDICGAGGPCWYEIEIENLGNGPLNGVLVTDELPAGLVINELTTEDPISCTEAETSFSCADVSINPGEVFHLLLEVQLAGSLIGPFANTVDAEAEGDQDPENNSSTAAVVGAAPGDANGDGLFNAADIVLLTLEKNDGDGDGVFEAAGGSFLGNPAMDVNQDGVINLDDIDFLVDLIFPPPGPAPNNPR